MLTYGFFNSVDGDRKYNADQIGNMFEGLIGGGIYESVGDAFAVTVASGMTVNVGSGRAIVNGKWVKNDATMSLDLNPSHVTLNRYTAIVLRHNIANRTISLEMIDGANASNPSQPAIIRNSTSYDICLAYIYVGAGVTTITQANISDMRSNSDLCGWVTGIIEQISTTTLFNQWTSAFNQSIAEMTAWQASMKSQFDAWFATLTDQLQVNTYIEQYHKFVQLSFSDSRTIPLNMSGYTYESGDVIIVSINGLTATEGEDYSLNTSQTPAEVHLNLVGSANQTEDIDIRVLKSKIGYSTN